MNGYQTFLKYGKYGGGKNQFEKKEGKKHYFKKNF